MASKIIFVNREKELAKFGEVLEKPEGQAILLVGQAAMGKSCLMDEMGKIALNHTKLRCGWIKYRVAKTDSVDTTMTLMMNEAFDAAKLEEGSFEATDRRLEQWRSLLNIIGIGDLVMSLRPDSKGDTRTQFLERLERISKKMPENGRAIFAIDPHIHMPKGSDQAWAIVIEDLPDKIKFVFAQRPEDEIAKGEAFKGLTNVIHIPDEPLDIIDEQSVRKLVQLRSKSINQPENILIDAVFRYKGHANAIQAALDLVEKRGILIKDLPPDPTPKGIAKLQWKQISKTRENGVNAMRLFKAYAVLEVAVPYEVVQKVGKLDADELDALLSDEYLEGLLEAEDHGKRIYHAILARHILDQIDENDKKDYCKRAVAAYEEYLTSHESWKELLAMNQILSHMITAECWDEAEKLLADIEYLEKKQQPENQYLFQTDFISLLQTKAIPTDKLKLILEGILQTITSHVESNEEDRKRKADWLDTFAYWINEFGVNKTSDTRALMLKTMGNKFDEKCGEVSKALAIDYEVKGNYDFAMRFAELYTWVWQRADNFSKCVEACEFAADLCRKEGMPAAYHNLGRVEFIRMRAYAYKMLADKQEKSKNLGLAHEAYYELRREFSSDIWMPDVAEWEILEGDKGVVLSPPSRAAKFKAKVVSNAHDCIGAIHIIRFFMEQDGAVEWIHHKEFAAELLTSDDILFTVLIGGPKAPGISDVALEFYRFSKENSEKYLRMYSGLHIEANRLYMKSENTHCYMLGGISKLNTLMAAYDFTTNSNVIKIIKEHSKS